MRKQAVILFAAVALLASCQERNLSDIETRLDNIENGLNNASDRISTIEATIAQINKDIESLQYLKAGIVINNVTGSDAAGWKITFASGKVVTVYPKDESNTIPLVSVSEDGYWLVDYNDGNGPQYLRDANGERIAAHSTPGDPGKDGVTPILGADAEGYWIVSYDGGQTFSRLLDQNGNPVNAKLSVGDSIFSGVVSDGSVVTFTLNDGSTFSCPIVSEFYCSIEGNPDEIEFKSGESKEFKLDMKGISNAIALCPQGWRAVIDGAKLTVTAPAATKGAISFDSSASIRILATSTQGYAVITGFAVSLFVETPEYNTYYEDWTKNGFVTIAGHKISSADFGETHFLEDGGEITGSGVWFIADGATVKLASSWAEKLKSNTMIIGTSKTSRVTLNITGPAAIYLSDGVRYVFANVDCNVVESTQPMMLLNKTYTCPSFIFYNSSIKNQSNAIMFSNQRQSFGELILCGSDFRINKNDAYLGTIGQAGKILVDNCIFYSKDDNQYDAVPLLATESCMDVVVTNNTFINLKRSGNGLITGGVPNAQKAEFAPVVSNNLRYFSSAVPSGTYGLGHWTLMENEGSGTWYSWPTAEIGEDYIYIEGGNANGAAFRSLYNPTVISTMLPSSPFSKVDYSKPEFVNTTKYGASR